MLVVPIWRPCANGEDAFFLLVGMDLLINCVKSAHDRVCVIVYIRISYGETARLSTGYPRGLNLSSGMYSATGQFRKILLYMGLGELLSV